MRRAVAEREESFALEAGVQTVRSAAKALLWTGAGLAARASTRPERGEGAPDFRSDTPPPSQAAIRRAWLDAFAKDVADVRAGLYPATDPMFDRPARALRAVGDLIRDAREVDARRRRGGGTEARADASDGYPAYYRQNFHFQSGGWFTAESARRYEPQVEALFAGAAGAMRRRALSLLARAWRGRDQRSLRIADLACGSGAFLRDLKAAFPRAAVLGVDLSPAYTAEAAAVSGAPAVQAAVERLPFAQGTLDGASSIYLFHELPPKIRRAAAAEFARVIAPGGLLALADSVQAQDEPELARMLEAFPAFFHEPFYRSYQETDMPALFGAAGFDLVDTDQAFLTKAWLFRRRD